MKNVFVSFSLLLLSSGALVSPLRAEVPAAPFVLAGVVRHTAVPDGETGSSAILPLSEVASRDQSHGVLAPEAFPPTAEPSATTSASGGLVINATFDSSITSNPNAAQIKSAINQAIAAYESLYRDPITVSIYFRYANTEPNGTGASSNFVGESYTCVYNGPGSEFMDALRADAKGSNDNTAVASLPSYALSASMETASASGRAIGLPTAAVMHPDGTVDQYGTYDGIVTLNSAQPISFVRPPAGGSYDGLTALEHEIDEVLGLGSHLNGGSPNLRAQDLFSWSGPGTRNYYAKTGARYFSIDGGHTQIVGFNQQSGGDYGDWYSSGCPQANFAVQDAFLCPGQYADVKETSPEGINLDVIGYDLASASPALVTVKTQPAGAEFTVDGTRYTTAQSFSWIPGTTHNLETVSNQTSGGVQYLWTSWSDGGSADHSITPTGDSTYTANFQKRYLLQMGTATGGSTQPQSGYYAGGSKVTLRATPDAGQAFTGWHGTGPGSYTGKSNPFTVTVNGPITETPAFTSSVSPTPTPTPTATPTPTPTPPPTKLLNISTRLNVLQNDSVLIGGFIVTGTAPKRVIIRALGPSLNLPGALANPTLELHAPDGTVILNDDWQTNQQTGLSQAADVQATGVAPNNPLESALVVTLSPGAYTAIVKGSAGGTGLAIIEAYDLEYTKASRFANISTRGPVRTGNDVMVGGFIIGPANGGNMKVIARGLGPSLTVNDALQNPTLDLHDANGSTVASNDDWGTDAGAAEVAANKLAPTDARESALFRVIPPGAYTAVLAGSGATTGVGLVEIYNVK